MCDISFLTYIPIEYTYYVQREASGICRNRHTPETGQVLSTDRAIKSDRTRHTIKLGTTR
jgi:hypothetical protein